MSSLAILKKNMLHLVRQAPWKTLLFITIFIVARLGFADDALSEAEPIVKDTYNGTLKTYLYIGEGVAAILTLMFTRNIKHLGGVLGVAMFFNIVAKLAGV